MGEEKLIVTFHIFCVPSVTGGAQENLEQANKMLGPTQFHLGACVKERFAKILKWQCCHSTASMLVEYVPGQGFSLQAWERQMYAHLHAAHTGTCTDRPSPCGVRGGANLIVLAQYALKKRFFCVCSTDLSTKHESKLALKLRATDIKVLAKSGTYFVDQKGLNPSHD